MSMETERRRDYTYAHMRMKHQLDTALEGRVRDAITVAQAFDSLSGSVIRKAKYFRRMRGSRKELEAIAKEASGIAYEKELLDDVEGIKYFKGKIHKDFDEVTHIKGELKGHVIDIQRYVSNYGSSVLFYGYVDDKDLSLNSAPARGIFARYECLLDAREKIHSLLLNTR